MTPMLMSLAKPKPPRCPIPYYSRSNVKTTLFHADAALCLRNEPVGSTPLSFYMVLSINPREEILLQMVKCRPRNTLIACEVIAATVLDVGKLEASPKDQTFLYFVCCSVA